MATNLEKSDVAAALNKVTLQATVTKLRSKLARQINSVKETEQHIAAMERLISDLGK